MTATDVSAAQDDIAEPTAYIEQTYQPLDPRDPEFLQDHHIFPEAGRPLFEAAGIDIDDYCVTVPQAIHLNGIHPIWNREWELFFADDPFPTREAIENKAAELMENYGLLDVLMHAYRKAAELEGHEVGPGSTGSVSHRQPE